MTLGDIRWPLSLLTEATSARNVHQLPEATLSLLALLGSDTVGARPQSAGALREYHALAVDWRGKSLPKLPPVFLDGEQLQLDSPGRDY